MNSNIISAPSALPIERQPAATLKPFRCRGCQAVLGYSDDIKLVMGENEFERSVTFRHNRAGCGFINKWYPAK